MTVRLRGVRWRQAARRLWWILWLAAAALAAAVVPAAPAPAADIRALAAEAYRAGRYDDGVRALRAELGRLGAADGEGRPSLARAEALYLLGRLELRKGELALELARASRRFSADHLARLAGGPTPLRYAPYFLGIARLEAGEREAAAAAFRRALGTIPRSATGEGATVRHLAELHLAALEERTATRGGGPRDLPGRLAAAGEGDPRVVAEAGWLLARVAGDPVRGSALAERALARAGRAGSRPPAPVLRAAAGARLAAGRLDDALALLDGEGAYGPAATERAGALLTVTYYDVPALAILAEAKLLAAARDLEAAIAAAGSEAAGLREAAGFAAARARLLAGQPRAALDALGALGTPATLGPAGPARVRALAGRAHAALGATAEAARLWQQALAEAGGDAEALGELAEAVADAGPGAHDAAFRAVVQAVLVRAAAAAEAVPRRAPQPLVTGLGWLTLAATGDAPLAVAQFERGRDKGGKNRIDANDPVFLARLAQAQVGARLFSEALEIYFEMGKTYPEVRQVQEALQGIYAAEQVAAGEAKLN